MEFTQNGYWDCINTMADEVVSRNDQHNEEDFIRELVDWSAYVVYVAGHEVVLSATDAKIDNNEVVSLAGDCRDWRKLREVEVTLSMYSDLIEAVRSKRGRK